LVAVEDRIVHVREDRVVEAMLAESIAILDQEYGQMSDSVDRSDRNCG
jgi:hypothetical protein